jgi:hypothetical protein
MSHDPLQGLARDRRLITPELHVSNDFYGHATILKRYTGISRSRSLKVAIEHGMNLSQWVWDVDLASPFGLFLCTSQARASAFKARASTDKRALAIGPLIRYLPPEEETERPRPRRVLLIPMHSTHHVEASYDVAEFLSRGLEPYADRYDAQVCLYWKDVLRGAAGEYRRQGFECVTAGHIYDPEFLSRFRRILRGASAVVTNHVSTHLFYSVLEGKPVWHVEQPASWSAESNAILARDLPAGDDPETGYTATGRLFADPRTAPTAEQREFVRRVTGVDQLRSAGELREILQAEERCYRERNQISVRAARRVRRLARNTSDRLAQVLGRV